MSKQLCGVPVYWLQKAIERTIKTKQRGQERNQKVGGEVEQTRKEEDQTSLQPNNRK